MTTETAMLTQEEIDAQKAAKAAAAKRRSAETRANNITTAKVAMLKVIQPVDANVQLLRDYHASMGAHALGMKSASEFNVWFDNWAHDADVIKKAKDREVALAKANKGTTARSSLENLIRLEQSRAAQSALNAAVKNMNVVDRNRLRTSWEAFASFVALIRDEGVRATNITHTFIIDGQETAISLPSRNAVDTLAVDLRTKLGKEAAKIDETMIMSKDVLGRLDGLISMGLKKNNKGLEVSTDSLFVALSKASSTAKSGGEPTSIPVIDSPAPVTSHTATSFSTGHLIAAFRAGASGGSVKSLLGVNPRFQALIAMLRDPATPDLVIVQPLCQRASVWSMSQRVAFNEYLIQTAGEGVAHAPMIFQKALEIELDNGRVVTVVLNADGQQRLVTLASTEANVVPFCRGVRKSVNAAGVEKETDANVYMSNTAYGNGVVKDRAAMYMAYPHDVRLHNPVSPVRMTFEEVMSLQTESHPDFEASLAKLRGALSVAEEITDSLFRAANNTGTKLSAHELTRAYLPIPMLLAMESFAGGRAFGIVRKVIKIGPTTNDKLVKGIGGDVNEHSYAQMGRSEEFSFIAKMSVVAGLLSGLDTKEKSLQDSASEMFTNISHEDTLSLSSTIQLGTEVIGHVLGGLSVPGEDGLAVYSKPWATILIPALGRAVADANYSDATAFVTELGRASVASETESEITFLEAGQSMLDVIIKSALNHQIVRQVGDQTESVPIREQLTRIGSVEKARTIANATYSVLNDGFTTKLNG